VLKRKLIKAAEAKDVNQVVLAGGVAANSKLRREIKEELTARDIKFYYPEARLCTDNAAMIASAGYFNWQLTEEEAPYSLNADPNLKLG
jgi:N6-L-threonylcarbamoyladenine synthase